MGAYWEQSESLAEMHLHEALGNLTRLGLDALNDFKNLVSNLNRDTRTVKNLYERLRSRKQRVEDMKVLVMEYLVRLGNAINNKDVYADLALALERAIQLVDGAAYRLYMYVENEFKFDEEIYNDVTKFVERLIDGYNSLYDGLLKLRIDPKRSVKSMGNVVKIEEELDGLYREVELKLFKKLSKNIAALMLLKEAVDFIEDVADVVRESAEAVRYLALHRTIL